MEDIQPKFTIGDFFGYALVYLLWLIIALVTMALILYLRNTLNVVWPLLGWSRWVLRPVDRFGLVFLGLVWLVYVIFAEQYYRTAITDARYRRLHRRTQPNKLVKMPKSRAMLFLRRLGLDLLAIRVGLTLIPPAVLAALAYMVQNLSIWLFTR